MMDSAATDRVRTRWRSLVRKNEFQQVYDEGVKLMGRLVVVYLLAPRPGSPGATSGRTTTTPDLARAVVASRKVGGAVARNRAKRLLREAHRNGILGDSGAVEKVRADFLPGASGADNTRAAAAATESTPEGLWVVLVARHAGSLC